jgi:uncharacterized protein with GYD domain
MPTYVMLSSLTAEGGRTLDTTPERIKAVDKEVEQLGCKVKSQYALLGPYDFLTVVEAPDNETIAQLSINLSSRGTVKIVTLPAVPIDGLVNKLKGAKQLGRRKKR